VPLLPNPRYAGWRIVALAFLCSALSSPGQSFAFSLYLEHLIRDVGISRVELSTLYAVMTLSAAACLPLVGRIADRRTGRTFLTAVLVLMGLALVLFASVRNVMMLGAAFFALRLLGQGAIALGTLTEVVRWFRRYRGRALAIVTLGYAVGEMLFPGTIFLLIERVGWRGSALVFAGLYLFVFAPVVAWGLRPRTEADGPQDGERPVTLIRAGAPAELPAERSFTFRETLRTPAFWGMLACVAVPPMVATAVIFHQVALFASFGWTAALVPPAFMAYAGASVLMTYSTGFLLERIPSRFGVALAMAFTIAAFASLALAIPGAVGTLVYGALLGLGAGTIATTNSVVWPDYFGVEALGAVKGVVNAARNGATAIGPPLAALLVTGDGSFAVALLVFGGLALAAGTAAVFLRPPLYEARAVEQPGSGRLRRRSA
jgi:MFS family permease